MSCTVLTDSIVNVVPYDMPDCIFKLWALWCKIQVVDGWQESLLANWPPTRSSALRRVLNGWKEGLPLDRHHGPLPCTLGNIIRWQWGHLGSRYGVSVTEEDITRPIDASMFYVGDNDFYIKMLQERGWDIPMKDLPPLTDAEQKVVSLIKCLETLHGVMQDAIDG